MTLDVINRQRQTSVQISNPGTFGKISTLIL